jgi:hypothetical protein
MGRSLLGLVLGVVITLTAPGLLLGAMSNWYAAGASDFFSDAQAATNYALQKSAAPSVKSPPPPILVIAENNSTDVSTRIEKLCIQYRGCLQSCTNQFPRQYSPEWGRCTDKCQHQIDQAMPNIPDTACARR